MFLVRLLLDTVIIAIPTQNEDFVCFHIICLNNNINKLYNIFTQK